MRIVLTGGPGSGKSTVLEVLRNNGYATGEDAARSIIRERKAAGLTPRPEAKEFADQILAREIAAYRSVTLAPPLRYNEPSSEEPNNEEPNNEEPLKDGLFDKVFFERGIVDVAGSLYGTGTLDEQATRQLIRKYPYEYVFLFPPWEDIYQMDEERDHTFDHSVLVYGSTRDWYRKVGYNIIEVPIDTPQARAEFILGHTAGKVSKTK